MLIVTRDYNPYAANQEEGASLASDPDLPRFLPNTMMAIIPAAYAWQLHGWGVGIASYAVTVLALAALGWTALLWGWPLRRLGWLRLGLLGLAMILIGAIGAQICDAQGACSSLLRLAHRCAVRA